MRWWFKAREIHTTLALGYALFFLLAAFTVGHEIVLPSFLSGATAPVSFAMFAPVALCGALLKSLDSRLHAAEDTSLRPVHLLDVALAAAVVIAAAMTGLALWAAGSGDEALVMGRNTAFLTGLMLCARAVVSQVAALVPIGWILLVILFGYGPSMHPYFWTVLARGSADPYALTGAALAFAAGLAAVLTASHRTRT
ncbi:hypothetical protein [Streptomyces sp. ODS28]|uniref:hypothetical protein n=1 Tax=Streptomyces sp. ODS28 TaxID=3136688 RepID=UPI0031E708AA